MLSHNSMGSIDVVTLCRHELMSWFVWHVSVIMQRRLSTSVEDKTEPSTFKGSMDGL